MTDSERQLKEVLIKKLKESKNKEQTINYKTDCTVVSKRDSPRFELYTGDVRIKQSDRCDYLSCTITGDGKYDTEIKRVGKYVFPIETNQSVKREENDRWRREMKRLKSENKMENRNSKRIYTYNQKESVETFGPPNEG